MAMEVEDADEALAALYRLPLAEFVAARDSSPAACGWLGAAR